MEIPTDITLATIRRKANYTIFFVKLSARENAAVVANGSIDAAQSNFKRNC